VEKAAKAIYLVQSIGWLVDVPVEIRVSRRGAKDMIFEAFLKLRTESRQDAAPGIIEQRHHDQEREDEQTKRDKCGLGPRREDPVVNENNEEWTGKPQQIIQEAERDRNV
jgi:hypothetical protein